MRMKTREKKVEEFHDAFGHPENEPFENRELMLLRIRLLDEEFHELRQAATELLIADEPDGPDWHGGRVNLLSEMADLQYVLSGMAVAFGLNLDAAFNRIHDANMRKLGPDGKPRYREDGKVLKPEDWEPADLNSLVYCPV